MCVMGWLGGGGRGGEDSAARVGRAGRGREPVDAKRAIVMLFSVGHPIMALNHSMSPWYLLLS